MAQKSSSLTKFWLELKRRKVFRVVAMYAGAAYVHQAYLHIQEVEKAVNSQNL